VAEVKQPIRTALQLVAEARNLNKPGKERMMAVAAAQDPDVLNAVHEASREGIVDAHLFGDGEKILAICRKDGLDPSRFPIHDEPDPASAARDAVAFADSGGADIIMKGFVSTSTLMKAVLSKEFRLRMSDTLSHVAVLDIPGYHKLVGFTDGGVVVRPDSKQKIDIVTNYLTVAGALGIRTPKIALLGPPVAEEATESFVEECSQIMERFAGALPLRAGPVESRDATRRRAIVEGPISLDCALSEEVAAKRGMKTGVGGDIDAIVVSAIEECNVVAKSLIVLAGAIFAGVVMGARVPVSVVSRTDTSQNKKASIALAALVSAYLGKKEGRV
jgi:phosphotransacetylase